MRTSVRPELGCETSFALFGSNMHEGLVLTETRTRFHTHMMASKGRASAKSSFLTPPRACAGFGNTTARLTIHCPSEAIKDMRLTFKISCRASMDVMSQTCNPPDWYPKMRTRVFLPSGRRSHEAQVMSSFSSSSC